MTDLRDQVVRVRDDLQSLADHLGRQPAAADGDYTRGLADGGALAYQTAAARLTLLLEEAKPEEVKCNGKCDGAAYQPDQGHPFIADPAVG